MIISPNPGFFYNLSVIFLSYSSRYYGSDCKLPYPYIYDDGQNGNDYNSKFAVTFDDRYSFCHYLHRELEYVICDHCGVEMVECSGFTRAERVDDEDLEQGFGLVIICRECRDRYN